MSDHMSPGRLLGGLAGVNTLHSKWGIVDSQMLVQPDYIFMFSGVNTARSKVIINC